MELEQRLKFSDGTELTLFINPETKAVRLRGCHEAVVVSEFGIEAMVTCESDWIGTVLNRPNGPWLPAGLDPRTYARKMKSQGNIRISTTGTGTQMVPIG
ncbi:MAG TPA: hypothetical protein VMT81_00660 [Candidatus Paceibacterota bacterium]|nr:hypothetical protein [Candidatus Paceibacterota bacterium]